MQTKHITHLPLLAAALYNRYRSGRRGEWSPPQFWEERSAEEQHTAPVEHHEVSFRCDVKKCKQNTHLIPLSLVLDIVDIDLEEEWGGAGCEGVRDPKEDDVCDEPPHRAGRKRRSEGCRRREAGETMAPSCTVGVLALMAVGRDGGGGRAAAAVLPIVRHGFVGDVLKAAILDN